MNKKFFAVSAAVLLLLSTLTAGCDGEERRPASAAGAKRVGSNNKLGTINGIFDSDENVDEKSDRKEHTVASVEDLKGAVIGVQLGTTGDISASDEAVGAETVEKYNKGADAVKALKQGKVDCVIIDEKTAKELAESNKGLKILDENFAVEEYAICVAKGNTALKDKINDALAELKADGTIQSIIDNYIGDETGRSPYVSPKGVDRSNGTLTMATNAEFPPYEYIEDEKVTGIDADIAQAIADKLGMNLNIENINFDAIINAVQSGKADMGIAGMTATEDRQKSVDFTVPYITMKQVIIVKK